MSSNRVPPQCLTSEMSVLGSIILDSGNEATAEVISLLSVEDFYRQDNRIVYQALLNLYNQGGGIDLVLLKNEVKRMGKLEEVGDAEYLVRLAESVPSTANAKYYAENVRDMAIRRAYISAGTHLVNRAYDETVEMDDLSDQADEIIRIAEKAAPDMICLDTVETQPIHWLWRNRFPLGKLSVIAGDPGLGKSFLTLSVASYVSAGIPWPDMPDESNPSGGVILMSAEDDLPDTIKPRLEAMSADCRNILALEAVQNLAGDLVKLERVIKKTEGVRLVVIDPISAYIGTRIDGHSNTEIRAILKPLAELASKYQVAILAVTHLNKGGPNNPIYRVMGSLAWTAAARTVWTVVKEKNEQPDPLCKTERRLLLPVKNNLAPDAGTGMAFFIQDGAVVWENTPIQTTAQDYFAEQETGKPGPKPTARDDAKDWLIELLQNGPVWTDEIQELAEQDRMSWSTVNRAKGELKIKATRDGQIPNGRWYWRMPEHEKIPPDNGES